MLSLLALLSVTPKALMAGGEAFGIPGITGGRLTTHQVKFAIDKDIALVQTQSRLVVTQEGTITVKVPIHLAVDSKAPSDMPVASIDDVDLALRLPLDASPGQTVYATANTRLATGNHTLRTKFRANATRDGLSRAFAYRLDEGSVLDRLEFIFKYGQETVLDIPEIDPRDWKWQTGKTGTYLNLSGFTPKNETVVFRYYSSRVEGD